MWVLSSLVLVLFLVEASTVDDLRRFVSRVFAGGGLGLVFGYVGVRIATLLPSFRRRILCCVALAFLAYAVGALFGVSISATVAMTGLMVAAYGYSVGLWRTLDEFPELSHHPAIVVFLLVAWLLFTWNADVTVTAGHVVAIGLNVLVIGATLLIARRLFPATSLEGEPPGRVRLSSETRVLLLVAGVLLLWPQTRTGLPDARAFVLPAVLVFLSLRLPLGAAFVLLGRELRFPDKSFQSETFLSSRGTQGPDAGKEAQAVSDLDCVTGEDRFEIIDLEPEWTAACPECEELIVLDASVTPGETLACPRCLVDLEVCRTDPLLLDPLCYWTDDDRSYRDIRNR